MKAAARNRWLAGGALLLLLTCGLRLLAGAEAQARGSTISRGPGGWLAARRYLEARGARVALLDQPLDRFAGGGVLVVAFPWQHGLSVTAGEQLEQYLRRGGDVVLAYSGEKDNPGELVAMVALGLPLEEKRQAVLNPFRWRRFAEEEWDLRPSGKTWPAPVRVWAPRWAPAVPKNARVLFRSPRDGQPVIVVVERFRGRIWLLPADAFANARLAGAGNADLLETLRQRLGKRWTFDEYHHGLVARRGTAETESFQRTLDLVLLHLALLYFIALLTLSRRFGPPWAEPPVVTGSAGAFLLGLGALHHRLGHHREAARRLLARVRELEPNLTLPADLDRRAEEAGPGGLVELAREVSRRRAGRPPAEDNPATARETAA